MQEILKRKIYENLIRRYISSEQTEEIIRNTPAGCIDMLISWSEKDKFVSWLKEKGLEFTKKALYNESRFDEAHNQYWEENIGRVEISCMRI